jgi:hypothetical protein
LITTPVKKKFAPFKDGLLEITEHHQVPVVSKNARGVKEISINKKMEEHMEK